MSTETGKTNCTVHTTQSVRGHNNILTYITYTPLYFQRTKYNDMFALDPLSFSRQEERIVNAQWEEEQFYGRDPLSLPLWNMSLLQGEGGDWVEQEEEIEI